MDNNSSEANAVWQTRKKEERLTLAEVVRKCRRRLKRDRSQDMED
jgi:hypothetical protein